MRTKICSTSSWLVTKHFCRVVRLGVREHQIEEWREQRCSLERCSSDTMLSLDYDGLEGFDFTFYHTHKFSDTYGDIVPIPCNSLPN